MSDLQSFIKYLRLSLVWQSFLNKYRLRTYDLLRRGSENDVSKLTFSRTVTFKNISKFLIPSTVVLYSLRYIPVLYLGFSVVPLNTTRLLLNPQSVYFIGQNFVLEKFLWGKCSLPSQNFVTFPQRKISPLCFRSF